MYNIFTDQKNEILSAIISACLWSKPHRFNEILINLGKIFPIDDESSDEFDEFTELTNLVLKEAITVGLIKKESGFFILTAEGRKKVEVDHYSVFKTTVSSFPKYRGNDRDFTRMSAHLPLQSV
jgi:hypothetical protein